MIHVIAVSEDGDLSVRGMTKELFVMSMNMSEEDFVAANIYPIDATKIRADIKEADPMYWGDKPILVIEGEIVTPEPISKVETWGLPVVNKPTRTEQYLERALKLLPANPEGAQAYATMALALQQKRTADAIERLADIAGGQRMDLAEVIAKDGMGGFYLKVQQVKRTE